MTTGSSEHDGIGTDTERFFDALEQAAEPPQHGENASPSPEVADQFEVRIFWLGSKPLISGRQYRIALGEARTVCTPESPKYRLDPLSQEHLAAKDLQHGEVGVVNIALGRPVAFRPYHSDEGDLGRLTLLDASTGELVAVGLIHFALRRATNVRPQALTVTPTDRSALNPHRPCVLWFTGLSGAGKSTISNLVEHSLNQDGCHTILLDGDNVRHGLNRDLGFTEADRAENIRRIAEVARLMTDAGLITLVSFISPFASERRMARELIGSEKFLEVFVDAPLDVAEARDVKGLYRRARRGEILNFTGIDSPYEIPESPDLWLRTALVAAQDCALQVLDLLRLRKIIA
jgi:bifunctional enzyme CysN/CysC